MARPIRTLSVSCAGIAAGLALLSAPAAMAEEEKSDISFESSILWEFSHRISDHGD